MEQIKLEFCSHFRGKAIINTEEVAQDIAFVKELAGVLANEFYAIKAEPFLIRMYEYMNSAKQSPTWELTTTNMEFPPRDESFRSTEKQRISNTIASQHYVAIYTPDHDEDYCGSVTVELAMHDEHRGRINGSTPAWCIHPEAERLARLTIMHYYEQIAKHYADWQTQYLNAPTLRSYEFKP